jgi:hypothetical protein
MNYLPELASNCDPPDLCFLSSKNYRYETLAPSSLLITDLFRVFIYFISFIHVCIQLLGHYSPLPLTPSLSPHCLPLVPTLWIPSKYCFVLISNFVKERVETLIRRTRDFY